MFLSTTTQQRDYVIYDELPPEVKIVRCCVTDTKRVRHLPRDLFRNPLLDHYTAQGRWVGTYDVPLNVNGNVETPEFKTPYRSAHRIRNYVRQLVQRRYRGAAGMMAWANHARTICDFNISALSEWSWNVDGRTEKEFALAWATINGMGSPGKVAQWAEWMGPIEFDVYDSEYPIGYSWGIFIGLIKARRRRVPLLPNTSVVRREARGVRPSARAGDGVRESRFRPRDAGRDLLHNAGQGAIQRHRARVDRRSFHTQEPEDITRSR